ncbi:MAG: hypothetical protein P0Y49_11905 [Candidatus Pedobacter colombiensis]|uniref:Uncharacterized protein n=1 Tax=Candidatus Pedobacter colombiensis TaxID=3121371 RepID=A0AAJ5W3Q5_9SPHI|nr:hypothetical protein [Pedobacter sp.]WEK17499.1 MAG: hypothetical protein P0Y49_11905 [Pedobacter sp.]
MKQKFTLAAFIVVTMSTAACKKENEVPPRQSGYILDYTIPAPTFLTNDERAILDAKRAEWDKL